MNHRYWVVPVILILAVLGGIVTSSCTTEVEKPKLITKNQLIKDVSANEAYDLIQKNRTNANFIIVDVRTPQEFSEGHIENAVNIDFQSGAFETEISKLDRDKTYLIYCRSGNRSRGALNIMVGLNFREVYHLSSGIIGWQADKLPVTK